MYLSLKRNTKLKNISLYTTWEPKLEVDIAFYCSLNTYDPKYFKTIEATKPLSITFKDVQPSKKVLEWILKSNRPDDMTT